MKKINYLYLIFTLSLLSCGGGSNSDIYVNEHISMENIKPLTDIIDSIRYVSLKDDKAIFSGRIDKITSRGDSVYLFDCRISKSLRAYKKDGEFLFNVGQLGRGPGEYVELANFTIDNQYFYIVDNAISKLLLYNIDNGEFVKSYDMPIRVDDIAMFEDGKFIFYVDDEPQYNEGGVFIADKDLKIIDKLFACTEDNYCKMATVTAFTENKDEIVFSRYANDTIVVFNKESYFDRNYYIVDFGSYKASKDDKLDHDKLRITKYIIPPVYITNNIIIGDVNIPSEIGNDYWMYGAFVYNMKSKQTYQNGKIGDILEGKIPMDDKLVLPIESVVDNEIVSSIYDYDRYQALVKLGFPAAPKHLEKQLEDGEPLLVFYTLKNMAE